MQEQELRELMCEVGRRMWHRGLVGATEGNLSCRLGAGRILCTPAGSSKGHLTADSMAVIDECGRSVSGGQPSSEIKLHLRVYDKRQDCQAVVHAHPIVATGFALAGETIPDDLLPESGYVLGRVALAPFGFPGSDEVPDAIEPFLPGHKTFLLRNHGAVAIGRDLLDAYHRMETLERIARVVLVARILGNPRPMPADALKRMAGLLHGEL